MSTAPIAVPPSPTPATAARGRWATWATLAVAALAAVTQTACIEPGEEVLVASAPQEGCAAWRQADRLDARLALDYQQLRPLPAGGQLRQRHGADVHATLALLQRDDSGAVWSGPVQQGLLALDDRIEGTLGHDARQLAGRGAPRSGEALAGSVVTVRVEFADCRLRYAARLALDATSRQAGQTLAVPLQELGRVSVSLPGRPPALATDGLPVLAGTQQVPAQPRLLDSGYRPGGLAAVPGPAQAGVQDAPAGSARLRWRFTPLRAGEVAPLA